MIFRKRFGMPIATDAVAEKDMAEEVKEVTRLQVKEGEFFRYHMAEDDQVYGLGENVRGINKRGWIYCSKNSDDPDHQEDKKSLYAAHNFVVIKGENCFGIFLDYAGKVTFDIGYTKKNEMVITPADWNFDFYLFEGSSVKEIVRAFRRIIGRCYIAPKWAFGYGQSRWGYRSKEDIREVVKKHRENGLPLDSVYMDIDYMERYKDFTVSQQTFSDFPKFVQEMKKEHIHLVPIIDAGVKKEEGYPVYEQGKERGYFCKKEDGSEFVVAVWPGHAVFPDFLNSEVREWFGNQYAFLLEQGIDGFWNDMNEPAIFYTEDRLKRVLGQLSSLKGKNLDMDAYFGMKDLVLGLANNEEDYREFYHDYDGQKIRHDRVHNLFGYYMTRAAGEAFERLQPGRRILMYSRSSCVGAHRYGGIWQGDNKSWWSHLLMNIQMCPSLNMCGFLYTGADLGGFGSDTTEDLMMRWLQFGVFTPLMRNHSADGTRRQEVYQFEDTDAFRNILRFRYRLLPYLYSEYMKAALEGEMYFTPLSFEYPEDAQAARVEDQLLVGESIMIAPVYQQNAKGRYVYLPEEMKMYRLKKTGELESEVLEAGHHYINAALEELVFFLRKNHMLLLSEGGECVEDVDFENLTALAFTDGAAEYRYYHDDGYGKAYENPENISILRVNGDSKVKIR